MNKIEDFSIFDYSGDNIDDIAATTVINSNKAVKQNLGIYRKKTKDGIKLYTGRYCGITWLRDKNGTFIQDQNRKKQTLVISPRFGLDIDKMITKIAEDEEFFDYLCNDQSEGDRMFTFFFNEEMVEVKDDKACDNRLMVAISFVHLLYMETQHSLIKKIIRKENNFTGKIKGKILFNKQIQKNIVKGHEERIYCGYVQKSEDIYENHILKYALIQAKEYLYSKKMSNSQIEREIRACELRLKDVSVLGEINPEEIDNIQLPVIYKNFEQVMKLAYLVIAQISMTSNLENDSNKMVPYAVNMPLLFECYCRSLIKKELSKDWNMLKFVANKLGKYDESEYGIKTIEGDYYISGSIVPDIVLVNEKEKKYQILDVKYKDIEWKEKKGKWEIIKPNLWDSKRRSDRLQMIAYCEMYQPELCGHICPSFGGLNNKPVIMLAKRIVDGKAPYYMYLER